MTPTVQNKNRFPRHGWIGLLLIAVLWPINWIFADPAPVTAYIFFPLWLGYCLVVDGINLWKHGTSLLSRSTRKYIGLFLISAPSWWLFEILNWRMQNWVYAGRHLFTDFEYFVFSSLSFSTVIPAVFGTAEMIANTRWMKNLKSGPVIKPDVRTTRSFALAGLVMLAVMLAWPKLFFPFFWLSLYFILAPLNIWLGNRSLAERTQVGDWRPAVSIWVGTLICGFFWEMWNWYSYPKWLYQIPWADFLRIFEMPLLGYGGYLPFGMEVFAIYHLVMGAFGKAQSDFVTSGLFNTANNLDQ